MTTDAPLQSRPAQLRSRLSSRKWNPYIVPTLVVGLALTGCGDSADDPAAPEPVPAIADGQWFALVTVGEDETGEMTLGVDLADMLTGEEARDAAVEDGDIAEGEDLPNDFYIDNPDAVYELLHLGDSSEILLISSSDTSQMISVTADDLQQLYAGTHSNGDSFYLAANQPIAMEVSVSNGEITSASQVYLP